MGGRGMLLVHAHPDDESINNGATMARYVAEGAAVTLVTCTLGELGEIIPPELAVLAADRADALGTYRIGELALACAALGVTDHRFLGGPGRWHDSGMMGMPDNEAPEAFWQADLDAAAEALTTVIREVRPQVVVSYDANGGYGHPDHIQAHRVTGLAFERAGDPAFGTGEPYRPAKLYAAASPYPELRGHLTTRIDGTAHLEAKRAAMRAHATQITVHADTYALSNDIERELTAVEYYTLLSGPLGPTDADGYETDLFAGIT